MSHLQHYMHVIFIGLTMGAVAFGAAICAAQPHDLEAGNER
jgi:hypothetical protein